LIEVKKNNEISKEVIFDAGSIIKDYEDIRSYATGGICSLNRPLGHDLFLKKGFLNWMRIQKESEIRIRPVKEPDIVKGFLPQDQEQEITLILANMILEERSSHVSHQWG